MASSIEPLATFTVSAPFPFIYAGIVSQSRSRCESGAAANSATAKPTGTKALGSTNIPNRKSETKTNTASHTLTLEPQFVVIEIKACALPNTRLCR